MTATLSMLAYGLLGAALYLSRGFYNPLALALVVAAATLCIADVTARWSSRAESLASSFRGRLLASVVAFGFFCLLTASPGASVSRDTTPLGWYRIGVIAAALLALSYARARAPYPRLRLGLLVGLYVTLGVWMIHLEPAPHIDVWHFQQRAVELLLHGQNPYASFYPNIYGGTGLYGSGYLKDGQVYSFTYPPLVILLGIPGWILGGDVRYSLLAAVAATACVSIAMGRRMGLPAGHWAELSAVALLFHPRAFFLIEQGWVDPYMALGAAVLLWGLAGERPAGRWVPLGLFLASKQYGFFWLPSLLACRRLSRRETMCGILFAAATAAPFLAWSAPDFWRGLVLIQMTSPFRMDALSLLTFVARRTGVQLPSLVAFVAAALVAALAVRRGAAPAREAAGGAAMFLTFFMLNKQAFLNYYWMVGALLMLATMSEVARAHIAGSARAQAHG